MGPACDIYALGIILYEILLLMAGFAIALIVLIVLGVLIISLLGSG
jgi:hypothetical protein